MADFLRAHALRIVPAYAAAVLYAAFVIGPLFTILPVAQFFASSELWGYVAISLGFFGSADRLPGVFVDSPCPLAINGSLWTLSLEIFCYAGVAVAGAVGALRRPWLALTLASALYAAGEWSSTFVAFLPRDETIVTPRLAGTFVAGALLYAWRRAVPLSLPLAVLLLVSLPMQATMPFAAYTAPSRTPRWSPPTTRRSTYRGFRRFGDYSYGIYVYAFPTQQAIAALTGAVSPWLLFGIAYPIVLGLAVGSRHAIERPALRLNRRGAPDGARLSARPP